MARQRMGRLGDCWRYWCMALELGCCARYLAHDLCGSHRCMVLRGVRRSLRSPMICSCIFFSPDQPLRLPTDTHIIHAALIRSTYPSLGSIVLGALILAAIRMLTLLTIALRVLPSYFPFAFRPWLRPLTIGAAMAVGYLESVTSTFSKYALVYTGLTGDPFFPSARRARALTAAVESASAGRFRRKFKTERKTI
jgi:hypothetical protein